MFRRIILEDWTNIVPIVSFAIFFVVFAYATVRALKLAERHREHLETLPLDDPTDSSPHSSHPTY